MFCNPTAVNDDMLNALNVRHVYASFDVPVCALELDPSALSFTVASSLVILLLPGLARFYVQLSRACFSSFPSSLVEIILYIL